MHRPVVQNNNNNNNNNNNKLLYKLYFVKSYLDLDKSVRGQMVPHVQL